MRAPIAAFFLLLFLGCNGHESPTAPTEPIPPATLGAVLTGRTLDPAGNPLGGVKLTLHGPDSPAGTATSNGEGFFAFAPVPPGGYGFTIADNGIERGGGFFQLLPGLNTHDVLVTRCIIPYGLVRDAATGRPIAGAKVTIFFRETTTDASGRYAVDFGCAPVVGSTIVIRAEHPDYQPSQTLSRASMLCSCSYDFLLTHR
jgi:hypothetical protein